MKHKLIIKSLNDGQAKCSCGNWYYIKTGIITKKELLKEYKKHALIKKILN